jgi:hypothetical protein
VAEAPHKARAGGRECRCKQNTKTQAGGCKTAAVPFPGLPRGKKMRPRAPPRLFWRSCWAGAGLWATRRAKWAQKRFWSGSWGELGAARSRQDEPIEVGEVESKRPSLGCNGVHVTWCSPLIARSSGGRAGQSRGMATSAQGGGPSRSI